MSLGGYDLIIIGAGVAGTAVGAIMASKERAKVLVLEQAIRIGGRDISFKGEELEPAGYSRLIREAARTWLFKATPDLNQIIRKGLLNGYTIEAGIHVLPGSEKGRAGTLIHYLGKSLPVYPVTSAGYFHNGRLYRFEEGSEQGGNLPWMSDEEKKALGIINREMVKMSLEDAHRLDHVPLLTWLKERTQLTRVVEYHGVVATENCTINDPMKISAGDNILMNRAVARAGKRFSLGGAATVEAFDLVPRTLAGVIEENGGTILTNARVREVIIEAQTVKGVRASIEGKEEYIPAATVVSTLPIKQVFSIIPETHFPVEFVNTIKGFWSAGAALIYFGLSETIVHEDQTYVPALPELTGLFGCDVRLGYWASSNMNPSRAPEGKQLIDVYISLTGQEAYNHSLVDRSFQVMEQFFVDHYQGFKDALEWGIYTVTDHLIPVAQAPGQVGDRRPRAACPYVRGLYFASDSCECSCAAQDAAIHSGIICASRLGNKDYVRDVLPEYHW